MELALPRQPIFRSIKGLRSLIGAGLMVAFMAGRSAALAETFPEDCQPVMTPP
jgi:hypothetical protein